VYVAGKPSPSVVSRERLDGNWSVERVEMPSAWAGAGEAITDDDADDTSKLLKTAA
jgi:hypothetical protein